MIRRLAPLVLLSAALATALAAGPAAFGRLALSFGWPSLAHRLLDDPAWQGVALYRAGRFKEADESFAAAGQRATFSRGNSLARLGDYPLAVAFYDAVLFREPADEEARANRALVASLYDAVVGEGLDAWRLSIRDLVAKNRVDAATAHSQGSPMPAPAPQQQVNPRFLAHSVVASRQWLATLEDEPGRYLKLRLAAEHRRRAEQGTAAHSGGDPW
jgi:Ca-activated chloride channel family protein